MTKLLGSLCVFAAGGMVWWSRRQERQKKRRLLSDLIAALGRMETEIRLARIPLPRLLKRLAEGRGEETRAFFQDAFRGLEAGETLAAAWNRAVEKLELPNEDKQVLLTLQETMQGDETSACKGVLLAREKLQSRLKELVNQRPEEEKRATALCLSLIHIFFRQRRQHGGVPADGGGAGHCGYDRGRLLRLCQYLSGGCLLYTSRCV